MIESPVEASDAPEPLPSLLGRLAEECAHRLGAEAVGFRVVEGDDLVLVASWGDAAGLRLAPRIRIGESLSGLVAAAGEPMVIADPARDPRLAPHRRELFERLGYRGVLAVPLRAGDRVLGVLNAGTRRATGFTDEDVAIASTFARRAAPAVETAGAHARERAGRRQMEALAEIERELVAELSPERLFRLIVDGASRLFEAECGIHLATQEHRLLPRVDTDPGAFTRSVAFGEGVAGRCAEARGGVLVNDYPGWPHAIPWAVAHGLRHVMAHPLLIRERLLGVIVVSRRRADAPTFSAEDLSGLGRFAALAAVVLQNATLHEAARRQRDEAERLAAENARLYKEAERRRREAEVLTQLVSDLNASLDLDTVLRRVVEGARELCGSDLGGIALREPGTDTVTFRYTPGARQDWSGVTIEPGQGAGGTVLLTGRPFRTDAYLADGRISGAHAAACAAEGIVAQAVVPIRRDDRVDGLLYVNNRSTRAFAEHDVEILQRLADHAAIAIHNARLFAERQRTETALRESETRFQHAQRMQAVGRLAGGIAHDFNNLLTVIGGRTDLLLRASSATAPGRRDLELIQSTVERAGRLTTQLLAFSRKQVLQPAVLDLDRVVRSMGQMLRRLIGEDVDLDIVECPDAGLVYADPGQVEQVLLNLAVNARDAMPTGGRLTIATARVDVDGAPAAGGPDLPAGPWLRLTVSDTGVGMDAETRAHAFEPFFTTKAVGEGTGLGLSTVYGIVRQSGGHIEVDSEPGRGTTFRIYLPRVEATAGAVGPDAGPAPVPRGSETILLVEDEAELRVLLREILEIQGYRVLVAREGREAGEVAGAHAGDVDLLITDVVMPGARGDEVARALVEAGLVRAVLYMSGYPDAATLPGSAFLQKPFTAGELARKAREVLDAARPPVGALTAPAASTRRGRA
jgi:signal transduction histidine kinase